MRSTPSDASTTQQNAHPLGSLHHPAGRAASGPASTPQRVSSLLRAASPGGPRAAERVTPTPWPAANRCQREHPLTGKSRRQAPSPLQRQPPPGTNGGGKSHPPPSPVAACRRSWQQTASPRQHHQPPVANASGNGHAPANASSHPPSKPVWSAALTIKRSRPPPTQTPSATSLHRRVATRCQSRRQAPPPPPTSASPLPLPTATRQQDPATGTVHLQNSCHRRRRKSHLQTPHQSRLHPA